MADTKAISRASNRIATEADRLSAQFADQLSKVLRQLERDVNGWWNDQTRRPTPANRAAIGKLVKQAGFHDLAEAATAEPFEAITSRVLAARKAAGVAVDASETMAARLDKWRTWHQLDLLDEASVLTRGLGDVVMRSDRRAISRLPKELAQVLDRAEARTQTLYDTAVSVFGRQVEAEQAGDDPSTSFVFMGPVDAKTRDFCLEHVGKVYTHEEIDDLDNGQLDNVFLTGGGWNCRHVWQEISQFSELHDTGEAGEIRDAVGDILKRKAA